MIADISSQSVISSAAGRQFHCADCSAEDPQWASLNKGVLICSECCYIHRNLGRHISHVRSIKKGAWNSSQLELMYVLYSNGSNNIWEHSLLDPQSTSKIRRKPTPHDPVLPIKENFIKAKYAQMAFSLRPAKDDNYISQDDLNRQLWSCVRTSHVETTMRLLALGADPNYVDPEKHNAPLHISAKENQALQVELLWIYGADPAQLNTIDLTPSQVAKLENHTELAARLEELQFEVTNRLAMFLCGRRPDHSRQQYFLIPELTGQSIENIQMKSARRRLRSLPSYYFERIVQDIYDEVDRRETVVAWNATTQGIQSFSLGNDHCVAVFLPPNPELSATRNQLRQKLAKFDKRGFAALVIDVLSEAKRRYYGLPLKGDTDDSAENLLKKASDSVDHLNISSMGTSEYITSFSEEGYRDYDEVADSLRNGKWRISGSTRKSSERKSDDSADLLQETGPVMIDDFLELKEKVANTEGTLTAVQQANTQILRMLTHLQSSVDRLNADNADVHDELKKVQTSCSQALSKRRSSPAPVLSAGISISTSVQSSKGIPSSYHASPGKSAAAPQNPGIYGIFGHAGCRHGSGLASSVSTTGRIMAQQRSFLQRQSTTQQTDYSSRIEGLDSCAEISRRERTELLNAVDERIDDERIHDAYRSAAFTDNLIAETEQLTHAIKLLLTDAQYGQLQTRAPDHAYSVGILINRILTIVPEERRTPAVEACLQRMSDSTVILSAKCNAPMFSVNDTCAAAFAVANSAKQLLVNDNSEIHRFKIEIQIGLGASVGCHCLSRHSLHLNNMDFIKETAFGNGIIAHCVYYKKKFTLCYDLNVTNSSVLILLMTVLNLYCHYKKAGQDVVNHIVLSMRFK
ncbi:ARF GTPase-activating protein [Dirofilaria immitis]